MLPKVILNRRSCIKSCHLMVWDCSVTSSVRKRLAAYIKYLFTLLQRLESDKLHAWLWFCAHSFHLPLPNTCHKQRHLTEIMHFFQHFEMLRLVVKLISRLPPDGCKCNVVCLPIHRWGLGLSHKQCWQLLFQTGTLLHCW